MIWQAHKWVQKSPRRCRSSPDQRGPELIHPSRVSESTTSAEESPSSAATWASGLQTTPPVWKDTGSFRCGLRSLLTQTPQRTLHISSANWEKQTQEWNRHFQLNCTRHVEKSFQILNKSWKWHELKRETYFSWNEMDRVCTWGNDVFMSKFMIICILPQMFNFSTATSIFIPILKHAEGNTNINMRRTFLIPPARCICTRVSTRTTQGIEHTRTPNPAPQLQRAKHTLVGVIFHTDLKSLVRTT